jgi:hypothetical protein
MKLRRIERRREWGIKEEWGLVGRQSGIVGLVGIMCGSFLQNVHREGFQSGGSTIFWIFPMEESAVSFLNITQKRPTLRKGSWLVGCADEHTSFLMNI